MIINKNKNSYHSYCVLVYSFWGAGVSEGAPKGRIYSPKFYGMVKSFIS